MSTTPKIPLSLYIHLPWCLQKCPYCDFNSHALRSELPEEAYLKALFLDLDRDIARTQGRSLSSIFFGGGTPSLFSPKSIDHILEYVQKKIPLEQAIEITLEANPGTFEQQKFSDFKLAGINRLSIGVQSFQDDKLAKLGRIHGGKQAISAVEIAHRVGFDNINVDLMYGLSEQSLEDAVSDINMACQLSPTHLSWYQLTLEPNTFYAANPPPLPDDEHIWQIQEAGQSILSQARFAQYEVSAYAKENQCCLHNINYWEFGDYLGIGAGSHSKLTSEDSMSITRFWKWKHPKEYLAAQQFIAEEKMVDAAELPFEFMLNALRLKRPIPITLFTHRTGLTVSAIEKPLQKAFEKKLLRWNEKEMKLTPLGWQFMNDVLQLFSAPPKPL